MLRILSTGIFLAGGTLGASAQVLMVVESTNKTVMLVDEFDGSLIQTDYIDMTPENAGTVIEPMVVNGEIWVSDQTRNTIWRYSLDGTTHLGAITGTLSNIRGFEVVGNTAYVSNAGTANGAPGNALVTIDVPTATVSGSFPVGNPFDVLDYNGMLLVANITDENLDIYDYTGNFVGVFHDSDGVTGIDFPEQLSHGFGGKVLAAGFSPPIGIFEYDSAGNEINFYDTVAAGVSGGLRGVWQLGNGNILFTGGAGVYIFDTVNSTVTPVVTGVSGRFIGRLEGGVPSSGFCNGDTGCPCSNDNDGSLGVAGCMNSSFASGCRITAGGTHPSATTVVAQNAKPGQFGIVVRGTAAGSGVTALDGWYCLQGNTERTGTFSIDAFGAAESPALPQGPAGVTWYYQFWYRDNDLCTGSNFSNGIEITW